MKLDADVLDACMAALNVEDTWGGDIVTAAIAALAHSTSPSLLLASTDFNSYHEDSSSFAQGAPRRKAGRLAANTNAPGLGLEPIIYDVLGEPVVDVS